MTKVLIRALSPISRTGLERMIAAETDLLIVKEESDGGDEEPDVIVSEVGPAEDSAREATMEIAEGGPAVLLLADDSSPFWTGEAIIAGARGILPRSITQEELAAAVRAAAAGLIVIHPDDAASYFPARAGEARLRRPLNRSLPANGRSSDLWPTGSQTRRSPPASGYPTIR